MLRTPLNVSSTGLNRDRIPQHVAIIMDGNGRWARAQGLPRHQGHYQGYLALKQIVYACGDLGVRYLTVYGFSSENWRRPAEEVGGLMGLMAEAMRTELDELMGNGIRVRISGRIAELPDETRTIFQTAMENTRENTGLTFTLAINYGGRAEIVDAVKAIVKSGLPAEEIAEETVAQHLYWPDVPDPDLLIRTAGEMRLSNFLLWETAYSELHVTDTPWPAFTPQHLVEAIRDYQSRVRRFGAVVE